MTPTAMRRRAHGKRMCLRSFECVGPVIESLEKCVSIETQGRWNQQDIFRCLVGMAAERQSVHSLQRLVSVRPCETSIWHHLEKLDMNRLESVNHDLLAGSVLDVLPKGKKCVFAIDTTDDPYYGGVTSLNKDYVVGDRLKKSTNLFYRYITLYLIERNRKITLATFPVQNGVPLLDYIEQFLNTIDHAGLRIKALLLDRGFYNSKIFSHLQKKDIPFIVPVKKQSTKMKQLLSIGRSSRCAKYTMNATREPIELKIAIAVKYLKGRCNKHGQIHLGYVVHGIDWKPRKIAKIYEKRFAIESSYRMRNTVRPRTTTKKPVIRYLLALISLLLKNIWVAIQWRHFTQQRRGPKTIDQDKFRFDHYRLIIWTTIAQKLEFKTKIPISKTPG